MPVWEPWIDPETGRREMRAREETSAPSPHEEMIQDLIGTCLSLCSRVKGVLPESIGREVVIEHLHEAIWWITETEKAKDRKQSEDA